MIRTKIVCLCFQNVPKRPSGERNTALTGARIGEVLVLQWQHIDTKKSTLRIEQSVWGGKIQPPKTQASIRTIAFNETLRVSFDALRKRSAFTAPQDFVFCKGDGSTWNPDVLRRDVLYPILDRLNIKRSTRSAGFHCFRHSAASIINAETGNMKLAQKMLGHSTLDMTANVYTHTSAETEREGAIALERAIFGDSFALVREVGTANETATIN